MDIVLNMNNLYWFILKFRNSNFNEFDLTKILKKAKGMAETGHTLHSQI
jgi:hypothetical protein